MDYMVYTGPKDHKQFIPGRYFTNPKAAYDWIGKQIALWRSQGINPPRYWVYYGATLVDDNGQFLAD